MKWRPSPPELVEAFAALVPGAPAVQRPMFGYPAAFVNGHMFMGLFQDQMILRLPEDSRRKLLSAEGARPFEPMPGRPMREYVVVPPAMIPDRKSLSSWVGRAFAHGASLPPKPSAARARSKPRSKARPAKRRP